MNNQVRTEVPLASAVPVSEFSRDGMDYKDQGRNLSEFYPTPNSSSLASPAQPYAEVRPNSPYNNPSASAYYPADSRTPGLSNSTVLPTSATSDYLSSTVDITRENKLLKRWLTVTLGALLLIVIVVVTIVATLMVAGGDDAEVESALERSDGSGPIVAATLEPTALITTSTSTTSPSQPTHTEPLNDEIDPPTDQPTVSLTLDPTTFEPTSAPTSTPTMTHTLSPTERTVGCDDPLPELVISCQSSVESYQGSDGNTYYRNRINIENPGDFPDALFVASPHLPPCGSNPNASRTWVRIFDATDDSYIYGYCGFSYLLSSVWFANTDPGLERSVYVVLIDRECNREIVSNDIPRFKISDLARLIPRTPSLSTPQIRTKQ